MTEYPPPLPDAPRTDENARQAVLARVRGPARGLIATAIVGALWTIGNFVFSLLMSSEMNSMYAQFGSEAMATVINIGVTVVGLAVSVLLFVAGKKLQRLESWGLVFAGAVLACVPCVSPCCLVGLPFGIWAIVLLLDDGVKRAFSRT